MSPVERRQPERAAPATSRDEPDWTAGASCAQAGDDETWFPKMGGSAAEAKRICRTCEVRRECLTYAMENERASYLREGVWGGLSTGERDRLAETGWRRGDPLPVLRVRGVAKRDRTGECPHCGSHLFDLAAHVRRMHREAS